MTEQSRCWVGGEWIVPIGKEVAVMSPSDVTQEIGVMHYAGVDVARQAVEAAHQAKKAWASLTGAARGQYLFQTAAIMEQQLDEIAMLASLEMGKPITEMRGEVMRGVNILRYYAGEGVRANGSVIPSNESGVLQYTKKVSLGVVAVITPWNFPVAIPIWKMAPALISGNTIVWKPAEIASLTASRVAQAFADAQLPAGVLNLVVGKGSVIGNALVSEMDIDALSFTGSTATGQGIAAQCARRNVKYQTEMGGKNAAVVLRDANMERAVSAIVSGAFRSAGQKCTATSRIIVEREISEQLTEALQKAITDLYIGSAINPQSYLGPVASKAQYETVDKYVQRARSHAIVLAEGKPQVDPAQGHYVMPMLVSGVSSDDPLVMEEIFGPVATLLTVNDIDEAISMCNKSIYGLTASVFTQNLSSAFRFLDEAEAGMVRVNQETAGVEYQSPFGGMKLSSSHTREQGQAALDFYTQTKTCAIAF
ncbi:aldehyde dehydrogenase family protein [Alicyclobacillus sp. ALC3]|uniref:aldehyde dehydrogenase family protein n=1 Tax=Alicyclobacillus sp. ALC3 TaxID=2796143 RepID=UPI0023786420|nr:aldehyde dehydrogenase family protein [Alicyclobacillus sp. ALC3]WDL97650.1 aldehyde dehydrogenase family protein [Alicyclobacillus sp. ALC3]